MNRFSWARAASVADAVRLRRLFPGAQFLAGGTNLVDLLREDVVRPAALIDISRLPLREIEPTQAGGLRVGALVTNSALARDERVRERYPLVAASILAGASPQIRNAATLGGNLLQRTRCLYFYDPATCCNKRAPGSGCAAIGGFTRMHAILGASAQCVAVNPSDMSVALAALDATVQVSGPRGARAIPIAEFHRLPGDRPDLDTTLQPGELITSVDLPPPAFSDHAHYLKVRDRASYAFALVSVAAALQMDGNTVRAARVALGGVAHRPWRASVVEQRITGRALNAATLREAAAAELAAARPLDGNAFKVGLAQRSIVRSVMLAAGQTGDFA